MGVGRDGEHKDAYMRGMALLGKYVLIAEGARGSLAKMLISKFELDKGCEPAKFGIGLKELWEVAPEKHNSGLVQHSFGWPLDARTGGGSFLYHLEDNQVAVGFVVHLNYENPWISPFDEFQRFKHHPAIADTFEGGKRLSYGARAITEGGFQSIPKLTFPGGLLIGCAAGLVNVPRIKGSHNAMVKARRGEALKGSDRLLFSGEFWAGGKALELGLVDRLGEINGVMKERYGEKVRLVAIPTGRGGLLRRLRPGASADSIADGLPGLGAGLADDLISAVEARSLWSRFGL